MNKILSLLIILIVVYQSFSPLVKLLTKRKASRKEYKLNFSKKFNHLFAATLLFIFPLLCISNYYSYFPGLDFPVKIALIVLFFLCWISAGISFYLYAHYVRKTSYQSLIYDPNQFTIDLLNSYSRQSIKLKDVKRVEGYSVKNWLKIMPWSNFEYLVLELNNGSKVLITSLIMAPAQLDTFLKRFEIINNKRVIPTISQSNL